MGRLPKLMLLWYSFLFFLFTFQGFTVVVVVVVVVKRRRKKSCTELFFVFANVDLNKWFACLFVSYKFSTLFSTSFFSFSLSQMLTNDQMRLLLVSEIDEQHQLICSSHLNAPHCARLFLFVFKHLYI